jgi:hypothetical protein
MLGVFRVKNHIVSNFREGGAAPSSYFYNLHWNNYLYFKRLTLHLRGDEHVALLHMADLENSECI